MATRDHAHPSSAVLTGLAALAALAATASGCSAPSAPPSAQGQAETPDAAVRAMHAKFDGQAVLILPFEPTNPACAADPSTMDRATFAACTHLDPAKLPDDLAITKDPLAFDLSADSSVVLVLRGGPTDPNQPEVVWQALVGLGPLPTSLVGGSAELHPKIIPIILGAAAAIAEGDAIVTATTALFAGAIAYFGGKAIVNTGQILSQQRSAPIVSSSQAAADMIVKSDSLLGGVTGQAQSLLDQKKANLKDGDWMAAAACVDDGRVASKKPEFGYGATKEAASQQALDQASNAISFYPQESWDDQSYCRVLFACQRSGGTLLPCTSVDILPKK